MQRQTRSSNSWALARQTLAFGAVFVVFGSGCEFFLVDGVTDPPPSQSSLKLSPESITIAPGETKRVAADYPREVGPTVTIDPTSSCYGIATERVFEGGLEITGQKPGDCSFRVYAAHHHARLQVTVLDPLDASPGLDDSGAPDADAAPDLDAGTDADVADANDGGLDPVAHLYVSDRTAGTITRFEVYPQTIAATAHGSFGATAATGLAFGPAGILYVGNRSSGGVSRFADVKTAATPLAALSAPALPPGWKPSGLLFVPSVGGGRGGVGAGELWVASEDMTDVLVVYDLDAAGDVVGSPSSVATGLTVSAGTHGIQGLAFDAPSSSLFVAADQVRRLALTRNAGTRSLAPMNDAALNQLGAANPVGLALGPNRWLFATYPVPSALGLGYWSVAETSTFINGAVGTNNTFSPLGITILPTQGSTPPIRVYTSTESNQVVALDVSQQGVPKLDSFVCNAPAPSWIVAGD
jgi:hypothetical protein